MFPLGIGCAFIAEARRDETGRGSRLRTNRMFCVRSRSSWGFLSLILVFYLVFYFLFSVIISVIHRTTYFRKKKLSGSCVLPDCRTRVGKEDFKARDTALIAVFWREESGEGNGKEEIRERKAEVDGDSGCDCGRGCGWRCDHGRLCEISPAFCGSAPPAGPPPPLRTARRRPLFVRNRPPSADALLSVSFFTLSSYMLLFVSCLIFAWFRDMGEMASVFVLHFCNFSSSSFGSPSAALRQPFHSCSVALDRVM